MTSDSSIARHFARVGEADPLKGAFTARRAVMPFRGRQRLPADAFETAWETALAEPAQGASSLVYLHVPFCANHCLFCGFYRNAYTPMAGSDYVDLVLREIEMEASRRAFAPAPVRAVYLGGGTPSALSAQELFRLLTALRRHLPLAPDCEITVEGRIIHFDGDKIDACVEAGANRFSIGVQSFDTEVRRRQGRRSTREEAIAFLEGVKARCEAALVIDLMYGLPGQTAEVWRRDIETAAALAPDGLDLYGLNVIPGTPLFVAIQAGKFASAPALHEIGDYYRAGCDFFDGLGWNHVSNNHWARTPKERNLYNRFIKEGLDCHAYGSGAGGSQGRLSYAVTGDLEQYRQSVLDGRKPLGMMLMSDALQDVRNLITGGLERGRLDLGMLEGVAGSALLNAVRPLAMQWQAAGLLTQSHDALDLTTAGRFWYGNLITALQDMAEAALLPQQGDAA